MDRQAKKSVAGHRGMVGSAVVRELKWQRDTRTHKKLNLIDQMLANEFFAQKKHEYVFLATKVIGYEVEIIWDISKSKGVPRKYLDVSKAEKLGLTYKTELKDDTKLVYEAFLNHPMRAER